MWTVYETGLTDLFLTTANATIKNGELVMGKGHALQMKRRVGRNLPRKLAQAIEAEVAIRVLEGQWKDLQVIVNESEFVYGDYYLLVSQNWPDVKVGLFQTKRHYRDVCGKVAYPDLMGGYEYSVRNMIAWSAMALKQWCIEHPLARVDMPFPGIGAGGCKREDILPLLEDLPDSVYVWELV